MLDVRCGEDAAAQPHSRARQEQLQLVNSQLREEDDKWQDVSAGAGPGRRGDCAARRAGAPGAQGRDQIAGASGWTAAQGKGRGWRRRLHSEPRPGGTLAAAGPGSRGARAGGSQVGCNSGMQCFLSLCVWSR